jgi:hypothetical protein
MKFQAKNPSTARIFIDYRNKKHPVKFEYPASKSPFMALYPQIQWFWIIINIPFLVVLFLTNSNPQFISIIFHFLFIPIFSTSVITKTKLIQYAPYINMRILLFTNSSIYYKKIKKLNSRTFDIPFLQNIFLHYTAIGEFSKYLYKVQILEHDFQYFKFKYTKRKIKPQKQDEIWFARFYFSKIPKQGCLKVVFK